MIPLAKVAANSVRIYLDQWDLSGAMNASGLDIKPETPVVTCFSDAGPRRVPANYDHSLNHGGFFDAVDGTLGLTNIDAALDAMRNDAGPHYASAIPSLGAGLVSYEQLVICGGQPRKWQQGQAIMLDGNFVGSNGMGRGLVLRTGTISGTGNGTGVNQGATTAGQIYAVTFRVLSGTFTSMSLKIQESSDDGAGDAYADVAGLTASFAVASTPAVSRATTIAATEAWKRLVVSAWNGTSAVILVTAAVMALTPS